MASLELVQPHARFAASYRSLVAEITARGEKPVPFTLALPHDDFDALIARLNGYARGEDIPAHFIAHSTFWLVDGDTVVGVSNLRHGLTGALLREGGHIGYGVRQAASRRGHGTTLLRETLREAGRIDIRRALLTCANANTASAGVILRNGGVFADETFIEERGEIVQRYWIDVRQATGAPASVSRS